MEEFEQKKSNRKYVVIIIILSILLCGLGGFIIYDKVLSPNNKEIVDDKDATKENEEGNENVETEVDEETSVDLSNVPVTDASCTFEYTMADYNNLKNKSRYRETCYETYKYIINDVIVDDKKVDVTILDGQAGVISENDSGLYINGTRVESLYSGYELNVEELSVHNNMLFVHIDGGTYVTGYTQVLAFNKNGEIKYNLAKDQSDVSTDIIHRETLKIIDGAITFSTYMDSASGPVTSNYVINYSNGVFSRPTIAS